jgi:hypothetical protein
LRKQKESDNFLALNFKSLRLAFIVELETII